MYHPEMQPTLDGWAALEAVVRLGGFAPAAERLNRSQSTISYAIARLQRQLGVKLFEMNGRRAHLTEVGRLLLADAEPHLAIRVTPTLYNTAAEMDRLVRALLAESAPFL